ncbi:hypothetical protein GPECTOR_485g427 [Gonium pectorale]|uniref:Uncharacterized protein n=1 Tax=Gonium pectorale TaxID=33097 RepID=A0A150FWJ5_GONPE|nr:hypothetical protein GPECTOR_485g427 [Gonium pectorale]|eukprot:KXZ41410.1 hypothetical protein GPECTOR_485g427 [Gonium pectorale]
MATTASQFRTEQERIDSLTMAITNPNVVGSGYIQFPPQKPFEKPVVFQPPTVAHLEFPTEYQDYIKATGQQPPNGTAAAPGVRPPVPAASPRPGPPAPVPQNGRPQAPAQPQYRPPQPGYQGQAPARPPATQGGLSKSQKKRLRKKLRDTGAAK